MKGRSGWTGVETTHQVPVQFDQIEQERGRQTPSRTSSKSHRKFMNGRVIVAIAGLAIACLAVFFVGYSSELYENWHARRSLQKATTFLQEGKLGQAAQMAQELIRRNPNSLAALSILADTAEKQNLEEAVV